MGVIIFIACVLVVCFGVWKLIKNRRDEEIFLASIPTSTPRLESISPETYARVENISQALVGKRIKSWCRFPSNSLSIETVNYIVTSVDLSKYDVNLVCLNSNAQDAWKAHLPTLSFDEADELIRIGRFYKEGLCCIIVEEWSEEEQALEEIRNATENFEPNFVKAGEAVIDSQLTTVSTTMFMLKIGPYDVNQYNILLRLFEKIGVVSSPDSKGESQPLCITMKEFYQKCKANLENLEQYYLEAKEQIEEEIRQRQEEMKAKRDAEDKEKIRERIIEKRRRKALRKEVIEELKEEGIIENVRKREPIPQEVQDAVWNRDGGRCVKCGSQENLEFDHIIPLSKGGSNTVRNLQLLCQKCNREKSNHIGE